MYTQSEGPRQANTMMDVIQEVKAASPNRSKRLVLVRTEQGSKASRHYDRCHLSSWGCQPMEKGETGPRPRGEKPEEESESKAGGELVNRDVGDDKDAGLDSKFVDRDAVDDIPQGRMTSLSTETQSMTNTEQDGDFFYRDAVGDKTRRWIASLSTEMQPETNHKVG